MLLKDKIHIILYILGGLTSGSLIYAMFLASFQRCFASIAFKTKRKDVLLSCMLGLIALVQGYYGFFILGFYLLMGQFRGFMWTTKETDGLEAMRILKGENVFGEDGQLEGK